MLTQFRPARRWFALIPALVLLTTPATSLVARTPDSWDGLTKVEAKKLGAVYLLPQADFRSYSKVMLDPPEIAFDKDWQRDYNRTQRSTQARVSDEDVRRAIDQGGRAFADILADAYQKAGYQVVGAAGADVLRIRTGVVNLKVNAPDVMTPGRSRTYTDETGEATLVVEVRDSLSGQLLGRALDRRAVGDNGGFASISNAVTNRADFEILFKRWARLSAEGLTKLKGMSPIAGGGK